MPGGISSMLKHLAKVGGSTIWNSNVLFALLSKVPFHSHTQMLLQQSNKAPLVQKTIMYYPSNADFDTYCYKIIISLVDISLNLRNQYREAINLCSIIIYS